MKNTIVAVWLYNGLLAVEMNKKVSAYNNFITISELSWLLTARDGHRRWTFKKREKVYSSEICGKNTIWLLAVVYILLPW